MTAARAAMTETMTEAVVIEIPGTLDKRLSPNRNTPPRTLKRLRAKLRDHVHQTARAWRNNHGLFGDEPIISGPATIVVAVHWEKGRHFWDGDNLIAACKAIPDGLQAAGIIANDRDLEWLAAMQLADPDRGGAIVVTIEGIAP